MKTLRRTFPLAAVFAFLTVLSSPAKAGVFDNSEIENLLGRMAEAAEDSPSLVHFGYTETEGSAERPGECKEVGSERVGEYLRSVAASLLPEEACDEQCSRAIEQLSTAIVGRSFL